MTNPIEFNPAGRTGIPPLSAPDKFLGRLALRVPQANQFMSRLGPAGLQNWKAFRAVANTFSESSRIQFLSFDPAELDTIRSFAKISKDIFRKLGINKWDFLCFMGFSKLSNLFEINEKVENLEKKAQELALIGQNDMVRALTNIAVRLKEKVINPQIRRIDTFDANTEKLKQLLRANWSENVSMSFEHPNYIWISSTPLPERFQPNNTLFGKWVINSRDTEETFAFAKLLLPSFATGELGTLKFELATRGSGISCLIVYCHDGDPAVKELIEGKVGRQPFWVSDRFCHEADAIVQLAPILAAQCDGTYQMSPELIANLKDSDFCRKRGISKIQSEMLWRLMHPGAPEYQNPDTAYTHVIDGYFRSISNEDAEEFGAKAAPAEDLLQVFLPVMLAEENMDLVCRFLTSQRKTFERLYSSGK